MKEIKKLLKKKIYKILGQLAYLKLLNRGFFILYKLNILKNNPTYKYHYFSKYLIENGNAVIDIGANLGYYTLLYREWVGKKGSVYAIEPIPVFNKILEWRLKKYTNVFILPYALGLEEKNVTLATPDKYGYLRTGLPHIVEDSAASGLDDFEFQFNSKMKKGSELFKNIPKIDFIKCDIEGYEEFVIPELKNILLKHKPILQVETSGARQKVVEPFLQEIGYKKYELEDGVLKDAENISKPQSGDIIFIHTQNNEVLLRLKNRYSKK